VRDRNNIPLNVGDVVTYMAVPFWVMGEGADAFDSLQLIRCKPLDVGEIVNVEEPLYVGLTVDSSNVRKAPKP